MKENDILNEAHEILYGSSENAPAAYDGETKVRKADIKPNIVPNVVGMDVTDAIYLLENLGLKPEFKGQGIIEEQSLLAGDTIKANGIIHLKLEKK